MSRVPTVGIDYTSRDYEAFRELLISKLKEKMPEYTDTSSTDAGIVILESLANGLDILSLYLDIIANDVLLPTTQDRATALIISKCLGYIPYNQTASEYQQVFVLGGVREESTIIPKGTIVKTKESIDLATLYYETMEDLIIPSGALGNEKDAEGNYLYSVRVQHGTSVYQDVVGTSSGAPLQSFKLNYTGVLVDSIELFINEGRGQELWRRVDNFIDSDETSTVYTVSVDEYDVCTINFGNGLKGKIPVSYPNGIVTNYRVGGGEVGNVNENIITELDTNVMYVESTFNLPANVLGHNKETLESIKENAPASFRTRDRLISLQDYEDLLKINFYPFLDVISTRDDIDKKLVHIFYILKEGYDTPILVNSLLEKVALFISERSMIGTTYDINAGEIELFDIEANMFVDPDYDGKKLVENVTSYIKTVTFAYNELKFRRTITKSSLESEIKNTFKGILSFRINTPTEDIIVPSRPKNIIKVNNINITLKYL